MKIHSFRNIYFKHIQLKVNIQFNQLLTMLKYYFKILRLRCFFKVYIYLI